tara:strand:+ start:28 stop:447 length:420 start_codon:yes stop_codon:yes gene_type:complete
MMIGGILLFVLIVFSLISEARSDGIEFSPELFGFGVVALVLPWYGYFQYRKTVVISWRQDERRVEVFEGIRNSDERSTMFAYTSEPRIKFSFSLKRHISVGITPPTTITQIRKQSIGWSSKGETAPRSHHRTPPRTPIF